MGSLEQILDTLAAYTNVPDVPCIHASDILTSRQHVLLNLARTPAHVHGAMEDRLPADLRRQLDALMPAQKKTNLAPQDIADYRRAYAEIRAVIFQHFEQTKGADRTSWCHVHHRRCSTFTRRDGVPLPEGALELHGAGTSCQDQYYCYCIVL
jgi:hypothetical protein